MLNALVTQPQGVPAVEIFSTLAPSLLQNLLDSFPTVHCAPIVIEKKRIKTDMILAMKRFKRTAESQVLRGKGTWGFANFAERLQLSRINNLCGSIACLCWSMLWGDIVGAIIQVLRESFAFVLVMLPAKHSQPQSTQSRIEIWGRRLASFHKRAGITNASYRTHRKQKSRYNERLL